MNDGTIHFLKNRISSCKICIFCHFDIFQRGDRVYTVRTVSGSYAEYTTANESLTFPLSDNVTFSQGAGIGIPYFTAYKALHIRYFAYNNEHFKKGPEREKSF